MIIDTREHLIISTKEKSTTRRSGISLACNLPIFIQSWVHKIMGVDITNLGFLKVVIGQIHDPVSDKDSLNVYLG